MTEPTVSLVDLAAQRRRLGGEVEAAIGRVLAHGRFILGPEVATLEDQLASRARVRHAVSCGSGTEAILMPLLAWGVGPGDVVFVPAFTFPATAEAVALVGATPYFVDVDRRTFNMCPQSLARGVAAARAEADRPVGVIPVDLFGQPADYPAIGDIAASEGLWVLADGAQSFGSSLAGRPAAAFATATATSFFPAKPLGCYGDGGAVLTDDDELAADLRSIRAHGRGRDKYDIVRLGINGRLDTLQAGVLLAKLSVFDEELKARRRIAARYLKAFDGKIESPLIAPDAESAWAQFTVVLEDRDTVARALASHGVETAIYYPRTLPDQQAYAKCPVVPGGVDIAAYLAGHVLSLPVHPYLSDREQERVIDAALRSIG